MTTTTTRPVVLAPNQPQSRPSKLGAWIRRNWIGLAICGGLLIIVAGINLWNLQGWPLYIDDDEGTYTVQAYAVGYMHHLAPYTYWYDHPPLGWIQMAAYFRLTDAIHRYPLSVMAGREFMWAINIVSSGLVYVLARRLKMSRWASAVAVVLFGLSPLAIYFHRMVWLDNIGTVWMLAALVVAASPKRSVGTAILSAVMMALSFWSKETLFLAAPVWLWIVWRQTSSTQGGFWMRHKASWLGLTVFSMVGVGGYLLFAGLRHELFQGPGHVSLEWAIKWQLFARASSGSILSTHSQTWGLATLWYHLDPWLIVGGLAAAITAGFIRRLWPFVLAIAIQCLMLVHGGYTPYAFIVAALPFLAILIAGVLDTWWKPSTTGWLFKTIGRILVVAVGCGFVVFVAPTWEKAMVAQSHSHAPATTELAEHWVERHVPSGEVVAVNDYMWLDIKLHSHAYPVWVWKINLDPWVMKHVLPDDWRSINYVVWTPGPTGLSQGELPTLSRALSHGKQVASFGPIGNQIQVFKVVGSITRNGGNP